jgi:hypothetical protein
MFTQSRKRYTIRRLLIPVLAAGLLLSGAAFGQSGDNLQSSATSTITADTGLPSVEQALVPEGIFAMQFAEALKLAPIPDEAKAVALLSGLGIEPQNGWITDYPVTPSLLGDIEKDIAAASDQGRIAISKDQALALFREVKTQLGLDVMPASKAPPVLSRKSAMKTLYSYIDEKGVTHYTDNYESIPTVYRNSVRTITMPTSLGSSAYSPETPAPQAMAPPFPDDIDDYYEEQGPPVVTYYSPPAPYEYLYTWTPYPFWSTGFYFPGFFVLNNFHRKVSFGRHPHFVSHHVKRDRHHHPPRTGLIKGGKHTKTQGKDHYPWFSTPKAQAGAKAIVSRKHSRNRSSSRTSAPVMNRGKMPVASQRRNPRIQRNNPVVIPWDKSPQITTQGRAPTVIPWNNAPRTVNRRTARPIQARPLQPSSGGSRTRISIPRRSYSSPVYHQNQVIRPSRSFNNSASSSSLHRRPTRGFQSSGSISNPGSRSFGGGARSRGRR